MMPDQLFHIAPQTNDALCTQFTYQDLFSPIECQEIVALTKDSILLERPILSDGSDNGEQVTHAASATLPPESEHRWIYERLKALVDLVNQHYHFNLSGISESCQLTRFDINDFSRWHHDLGTGIYSNRKLTIVVHLSAPKDIEGGSLQTLQQGQPADCEWLQGSATIMPAYETHRVTPVEKGSVYMLTGWISGPAFS